jgi:hypothetical protein
MPTECNAGLFDFGSVEGRRVVAGFDGGRVTSDAGALLLGATDKVIGLIDRFAACFSDGRSATDVEHTVATLVGQRVFGIARGYEDLIDHDQLRHDPVLATLAGKLAARRSRCAPLAAKLRRANMDASSGARDEVARIVDHIRRRWPRVRILLRGDGAFAREELMAWCERSRVDYVFGLARNDRLVAAIEAEMADASAECRATERPARRFKDLLWSTLSSWSRRRRVIGKAEALPLGDNPRFIVTSLQPTAADARLLYERVYCARGEMENRIKECQLDLFADRTSAKSMRANQLRLWFASMAYVLLCALRRIGFAHTRFAQTTCGTIRLQLLKIGALVRVSVRRVKMAMASAFPHQHEFALAHALLRNAAR